MANLATLPPDSSFANAAARLPPDRRTVVTACERHRLYSAIQRPSFEPRDIVFATIVPEIWRKSRIPFELRGSMSRYFRIQWRFDGEDEASAQFFAKAVEAGDGVRLLVAPDGQAFEIRARAGGGFLHFLWIELAPWIEEWRNEESETADEGSCRF